MHRLHHEQILPISLEEAWEFFSNPKNLEEMTPPEMNMRLLTDIPRTMKEGSTMVYQVTPILSIPLKWVARITTLVPQSHFIDEQVSGPYKYWHHEHRFEAVEGGVKISDLVHYRLPLEWVSGAIHKLIVKPKLERTFAFRERVLEEKFGTMGEAKKVAAVRPSISTDASRAFV